MEPTTVFMAYVTKELCNVNRVALVCLSHSNRFSFCIRCLEHYMCQAGTGNPAKCLANVLGKRDDQNARATRLAPSSSYYTTKSSANALRNRRTYFSSPSSIYWLPSSILSSCSSCLRRPIFNPSYHTPWSPPTSRYDCKLTQTLK
jgi:hypothetical protein